MRSFAWHFAFADSYQLYSLLAVFSSDAILMLIFTNEEVLINYGCKLFKNSRFFIFDYRYFSVLSCYNEDKRARKDNGSHKFNDSLCNIILNAIFIFGGFGIAPMGVRGAALATLIARIIELCCSVLISYKPNYLHPSMCDLLRRNKQLSKDFWKCGLPLLGACLFWGIGFTSYSSFMGHLGTDAAAANSVAAVVRDIICCFSAGISSAAGIMIGNELGAGNLEKGKRYGIRLLKISFACGIFASLLMCISAPIILHFVKLTPQAQEYLKGMFAVIAFYMIGRAVNDVTINGIFGAGGDTLFDMYSLAVCMWCLAIPLAAAGTYFFHWPVVLVYACTCIDEVGKLPWVLHHFRKYNGSKI